MYRKSYDFSRRRSGEAGCQWSAASYPLTDIHERIKLPVVVKVDHRPLCLTHTEYPPAFLTQPLLLYEANVMSKFVTRHYAITPGCNNARVGGEALVLPHTYTGWFVHLKASSPGVVTFHQSIEEVSQSNAAIFISKFTISGWNMASSTDEGWQYQQQAYAPGSIFRVDSVYVGNAQDDVGFRFFAWKKKFKEIRYLKCTDSFSRSVLFPMTNHGTFFEILKIRVDDTKGKLVVTTSELFTLPKLISPLLLIYGAKPFFVGFSGIIELEKKVRDESIVAAVDVSTTIRPSNRLVELSLDSSIQYLIALNSNDMMKRDSLADADKLCTSKANVFSRSIHIPFSLALELPENIDCVGDDTKPDKLTSNHMPKLSKCKSLPVITESPDADLYCDHDSDSGQTDTSDSLEGTLPRSENYKNELKLIRKHLEKLNSYQDKNTEENNNVFIKPTTATMGVKRVLQKTIV